MVTVQAVVFGVAVVRMGYSLRSIAPRAAYRWSIAFLAFSPVVGYSLLYDFHPTVLGLPNPHLGPSLEQPRRIAVGSDLRDVGSGNH